MTDSVKVSDEKVALYFIGVDYPADIGTLSYNVRGMNYQVPRDKSGAPDVGAAIQVRANDVTEMIEKSRYFNGKKQVEVFTVDADIAASVKTAFKQGKKTPIEARMDRTGSGDVVVAPTKEEIKAMLTDEEVAELVRQRGLQSSIVPDNLSGAFAPNADESALARAAAVTAANQEQKTEERPLTAAEKKKLKELAEKEMTDKLSK